MAKLATYWQRGEAIDYKNETAAVIPANTLLIVGSVLGVAGMDIPAGEVGSLHKVVRGLLKAYSDVTGHEGVFEIPKKASTAVTAGAKITYTDTDGASPASGSNPVYGYAVEAAAAEAATVLVKLLG